MTRTVAIDWSGREKGEAEHIWIAEVEDGRLCELHNGRTRHEVVEYLIELNEKHERLVVGLDFAFSFPRWYIEEQGWKAPEDVWRAMRDHGGPLLAACDEPFWGRPGRARPHGQQGERQTDLPPAKSVFQIGGAGAVGTGSIRGMACLATLREEGFCIWPFHDGWPRVIEIYPRTFAKEIVKTRHRERLDQLRQSYADQPCYLLERAAGSEDAFDATISALAMAANVEQIASLRPAERGSQGALEGEIWRPSSRPPTSGA